MTSNKSFDQGQPAGVQRDSETPVPQKPSVLFILSTSAGVLTLIYVAYSLYHGFMN